MLDLGLRSGEVARLSLDDIDWDAGTITLRRTKARREDVMPLPQAAGQAIAAYLRDERPKTQHRMVFARHMTPRERPIGRKDRSVPLWKSTAATIRAWLHANPDLRGSAALLPDRSGHPMTRCNVAQRLTLAVDRASIEQPSLKTKRVSPHSLRHTTAMHLLQSGVPFNIIALWLGHESTCNYAKHGEPEHACRPSGRRRRVPRTYA